MNLGSPYTDVRITTPALYLSIYDLQQSLPGLMQVNLHPPASGPEIELVFGTAEGVEPAPEDFIRSEVERITESTVLAIRQRGLGDG